LGQLPSQNETGRRSPIPITPKTSTSENGPSTLAPIASLQEISPRSLRTESVSQPRQMAAFVSRRAAERRPARPPAVPVDSLRHGRFRSTLPTVSDVATTASVPGAPGADAPARSGAGNDPDVAAISVRGLRKSFNGREVLRGIDLEVPRGTTTVILGGSGSGKSVLMKHMIGLLKPDAGAVRVEGEDVVPLSGAELGRVRRRFGMVFQNAALFDSMTVADNVAFPLREHLNLTPDEVSRRVAERLALVGLTGSEQRYPAELSGGMRKRVGLARAVVLDPSIVLYDEPTTGLDPITTDNVDEMILDAKAALGVTSVVISHDIGSAFKIADQIAFLYDGTIVEHGTPTQLRASEHPRVREFLRSWFEKGS